MRKTLLITTLLAGAAVATNAWAWSLQDVESMCEEYPQNCTYTGGRLTKAWDEGEWFGYNFTYDDDGHLISAVRGEATGKNDPLDEEHYFSYIKYDAVTGNKTEEYSKPYTELLTYTKYDAVTGHKIEEYKEGEPTEGYIDGYTKFNENGYPIEVNYADFSFDETTGTATITETGQKTVYAYETNDDGELVQIMSPGADWDDSGYDPIGRTTIYNTDGSIKSTIELYSNPAIDDGAYDLVIDGENAQTYAVYSEETNTFLVCDYEVYPCSNPTGTYSSIVNILKGITVADEEAANKPQSTRTQLADGSTRVVDPDGKIHYEGKRIYTIDEVNEVAGKTNSVKIRYR